MGSEQGVVYNESPFPIEYIVYGRYDQLSDTKKEYEVNPKLEVGTDLTGVNAKFQGFQFRKASNISHKYDKSFVRVQPQRHNISALSKIEMNKHKISVRVIIDEFQKYILSDVIIKAPEDMRLKIRYDLSIKNMQEKEAKKLIEKDKEITRMPTQQQRKEAEERRKIQQEWRNELRQAFKKKQTP